MTEHCTIILASALSCGLLLWFCIEKNFLVTTATLVAPGLCVACLDWLGLQPGNAQTLDFILIGLFLLLLRGRIQKPRTSDFQAKKTSSDFELLLLPGIYLVGFAVFQLALGTSGFSFLLNTWDGSSNPGLVRALEVTPNLTTSTSTVTQWESYPSFAHQFIAMISRTLQFVSSDNPRTTLVVFAFLSTTIYSLLVFHVGRLASTIVCRKTENKRAQNFAALLSQVVLLIPRIITDFALMHSVSFMMALTGTLVTINQALSGRHKRDLVSLGVATTLVSGTYPLLSLLPLLIWFVVAIVDQRAPLANLLASFAVAPALVLTYLSLSLNSTSGRLQATGHIVALPSWLIPVMAGGIVLSVLPNVKQRTNALLAFVTLMVMCFWQFLWISSPSLSREYGLNYYAKKFEYAALVLLVPVVIGLLCPIALKGIARLMAARLQVVGPNASLLRFLSATPRATAMALVAVSFVNVVVIPTVRDKVAHAELDAALKEAQRPGPGIVWFRGNEAKALTPSLMANYLDKSLWAEPFIEDLNLRLFQSAQGNNTDHVSLEMCQASSRLATKTRITYLNPQEYEYCGG